MPETFLASEDKPSPFQVQILCHEFFHLCHLYSASSVLDASMALRLYEDLCAIQVGLVQQLLHTPAKSDEAKVF